MVNKKKRKKLKEKKNLKEKKKYKSKDMRILEVNNIKLTMIVSDNNRNLYLSCRNLNHINLVSAQSISTYDIVNSNMLLFDKASVEFLNESL